MQKKAIIFLFGIFSFLCAGCATIDYHSMNLIPDVKYNKIVNLRNCGIITSSQALDVLESDEIVKNKLFDVSGPQYGYYHLYLGHESEATAGGILLGILNIFTVALPNLIGIPLTRDEYTLRVNLEIFDSNGILIKKYHEHDIFKESNGLYYGHNLKKRANKKYSQMIINIMERMTKDSDEINRKLMGAGQITKFDQNVWARMYVNIAMEYSTIQPSKQTQPFVYEDKNPIPPKFPELDSI
jgi:hypothetical protein